MTDAFIVAAKRTPTGRRKGTLSTVRADHLGAVVLESLRTGVNLPRAMITGCKTVPDDVKLEP